MEGYGTYTWANGQKYAGEFKEDNLNGSGTLNLLDGQKYVGEFVNGKYNGQGTFTSLNGVIYIGQFKEGKAEGQGTKTCISGTFVGEMKEDTTYKGTFTGKNGITLTGTFSGEIKSGTINYPDGRKYEGEWTADPTLLGIPLETIPLGSWVYEQPHGLGKMAHPDGTIQKGLWEKGQFVGKPVTE